MFVPECALPGNRVEEKRKELFVPGEDVVFCIRCSTRWNKCGSGNTPVIYAAYLCDNSTTEEHFERDAETLYQFLLNAIPYGTFEKVCKKLQKLHHCR